MALLPWCWLLAWKALHAEHNFHRWALACGALAGVGALEGGSSPVVYGVPALALLLLGIPFAAGRWRGLKRLVATGVLAAVAAGAVAGCQLLPMLDYLKVTGRAGGLPWGHASARILEYNNPLPGTALWVVMGLGFALLAWRGPRRAAVWFAAVAALGYLTSEHEEVFRVLWLYAPGFSYQRIPQRALVLLGAAGSILAGAGVQAAYEIARGRRWLGLPLALVLAGWLGYELWQRAPAPMAMADVRIERKENSAIRWLVEHARGTRIHIWESENRHWGADNVTQPFELEVLASYTPTENRDYLPGDFDEQGHRTFHAETYSDPAKFWGLLGVRYVTSTGPRGEGGFHLATMVPRCAIEVCQPTKSAGPFIYENDRVLPRLFRVSRTLVLVGEPRKVFEASLDIMKQPAFDPGQVAILQIVPGEPMPDADAQIAVGDAIGGMPLLGTAEGDAAVNKILDGPKATVNGSVLQREGPNRFEAVAPAGEGWIVVSEKMAIYRGWSLWTEGNPTRFVRADGVLAAFKASPGVKIEARYRPPGFLLGLAGLVLVSAGVAVAELWLRRRRAVAVGWTSRRT
jgi:hypothetical protein